MASMLKMAAAFLVGATFSLPSWSAPDLVKARASIEGWSGAKIADLRSVNEHLIEFTVDGRPFYADATGSFLIDGSVIDLRANINLTARRQAAAAQAALAGAVGASVVKEVRGSGARTIGVFTDPNCRFCHALEVELSKLTDVTIIRLPVGILGDASRKKSSAVLCSPDRMVAWRSISAGGDASPRPGCDMTASVDANAKLMASMGFKGTPGIVFADGTTHPGLLDSTKIVGRIQAAHAAQAARSGGVKAP